MRVTEQQKVGVEDEVVVADDMLCGVVGGGVQVGDELSGSVVQNEPDWFCSGWGFYTQPVYNCKQPLTTVNTRRCPDVWKVRTIPLERTSLGRSP
jgi:hypothetical protein